MNGDELKYLGKKFVELDTKFGERWNAHDKTADSRNIRIETKLDKIFSWLEKLPCGVHEEAVRNLSESFRTLINNDIRHLNLKLNALLITVLSGVFIGIIMLFINFLANLPKPL